MGDVSIRFKIPEGVSRGRMETLLAEQGALLFEAQPPQTWHFLDTFDRRLAAGVLMLKWSGAELLLCALPDDSILHRLRLPAPPRFASDLPEGPLREQLAAAIDPRALLEIAVVTSQSWHYRLLDDEAKTLARLVHTEARLETGNEDAPQFSLLTVRPLRGYDREAARAADQLRSELSLIPTDDDVPHWALDAAGDIAGRYSSKLDVQLAPQMPAAEATRLILLRLLETMRANEAGIKADIDIEFLHDYRIALRRTRSALRQMRGVFPRERVDYFRGELRTLGRMTNNLRDLDVYLAAEAGYRAILPAAMQEDITPLFDYLRSHRAGALAEVVAGLESADYARLVEEWAAFLGEAAGDHDPAQAFAPIIRPARRRIARQYGGIVRDGTRILERGEDDLLHTLRIEGKELRYLLEFFAGLFPPAEVAPLIKRLRRLQDNLGAYTDLDVQQAYLLSIAEALDIEEARARRALVATGFLVETMAREQRALRANFAGAFHDFTSPAQQRQFTKLFGRITGVKP